MDAEERIEAIRACGVREVIVLDFTSELAALEPGEFLQLIEARHPFGSVRCGANWRFGRGGAGDAVWLRAHGCAVDVVPYAMHGGEPISSSRIRACLGRGDIEEANAMMGRRVCASARSFSGKGMGRELGWPTVNFESDAPMLGLLPRGVYLVEVDGLRGVANYGVAPTMDDRAWSEPVLEVHFLDGAPLVEPSVSMVSFIRFLRPERRFASIADLKCQIAADCAAAMEH